MTYRAPVSDYQFIFDHIVDFSAVLNSESFSDVDQDTVLAILEEAGKLASDVIAPLDRGGDLTPAQLVDGVVKTSPGFADALGQVAEGGWIGMLASPDNGGMGLPLTVGTAVNDMMSGACLALSLYPLMCQGQIEALEHHASDDLKAVYLPKLVSGEWCGTMNLTEPGAGSDVGALRTKAERNGDGSYSITGQKIFITWGDNDFSENVCHLVLARLPDGAPGTKGISLFMVPKVIPNEDGSLGEKNSLHVVSLEHKLGIHGSPTCVMEYDGAKGWLVGEEHQGMKCMFTMMNNARLGVGVQGVGIAEAATQKALAYAQDRVQGKSPLGNEGAGIIDHADVRRMLATMRADTFVARSIALACGVALDLGRTVPEQQARGAFLIPIAKAFSTDIGHEVAQTGVQVHGGMGYIEETGAAQYARDARITSIYEGTNGIQAMDLVGRKLMDGGEAAFALLDEIETFAEAARATLPKRAIAVWNSAETLREGLETVLTLPMNDRFGVAVPFLRAFARVLGGYFHLKAAIAEGGDGPRSRLAAFYIKRMLPEHRALLAQVRLGAQDIYALSPEDLTV
ncbi:acyl-CoA dehydrogenase family protein [Celeribacter halophilus]|jgi:alkylation response protein AidB-like acyl-CoA dehydrogenase|uniref:3-methylmercaptopropionyl-CoA dehydrogenase n=1 Tax=Celeribacter halophilus TaxID=576117 RepID=A0AAW7XWE4_9RHOB|nr:acyl-CoA dehydrogenase family protein [Celeribacter halophilus]MDO6458330.1 acyl-CoA dehydrogenase family protein [Celeribacter halophilus]MDO6724171.1 acyl-CoA dehydrogenase family protein [Celeribacter halophilus]